MTSLARPDIGRYPAAAILLSGLAAIVTYLLATQVFPYHTTNHDEAVYLQQAAMLLEGQIYLRPPVEGAFRPWFFVADGGRLYPKYAPVPAGMFAAGKLFGSFRFALAAVSAGVVGLTYRTVAEGFERQVGVLAAALVLASPLFLVDAAVFLPYVPTTFLNLAFAAAYLQADRTGSRLAAAVAGVAVGLAFFARPFTAVLFALPFVVHALWTLREGDRSVLVRQGIVAALGLAGVAVALGYNAVVTGDPLVFPYQAFAPRDGLGFGHREILGYRRDYTPTLALRTNAEVLWSFATRWVVAGPLGTLLAALGLVLAVRRGVTPRRATLAGLFLTIPAGNLLFWGNLNVLGELDRSGDGLVHLLGPYYHVDLLVPTAAFAAVGLLAVVRWAREAVRTRVAANHVRRVSLGVLVLAAAVGGATTVAVAAAPISDNYGVTEQYEHAYAPFEERPLSDSVVLLPTPYGDWLNHPFQSLRNDPSFDGETVYALRENQFAVADAYDDRTLYRYVYRGAWTPEHGDPVEPHLERVRVVSGERVREDVRLGVPEYADHVSLRLAVGNDTAYATAGNASPLSLAVEVNESNATLSGPTLDGTATVPTSDRDTVVVTALVDYGTGAGFLYRIELPVERTGEGVRALTSYDEVCRGANRCGGEAAYVPGAHDDGVFVETNLTSP